MTKEIDCLECENRYELTMTEQNAETLLKHNKGKGSKAYEAVENILTLVEELQGREYIKGSIEEIEIYS